MKIELKDNYGVTGWGIVIYGAAVLTSLFIILVSIGAIISYNSCAAKGRIWDRQTEWSFWAGCFVEHGGEMVPLDYWQQIYLENGDEVFGK